MTDTLTSASQTPKFYKMATTINILQSPSSYTMSLCKVLLHGKLVNSMLYMIEMTVSSLNAGFVFVLCLC